MPNMRGVDEQSHKDEMRAALRGDFERLRARRDETEPVIPALDDDSPVVPPLQSGEPSEQPSGSWLARLLGR